MNIILGMPMKKFMWLTTLLLCVALVLTSISIPNVLGSNYGEEIVVAWDEEFNAHTFVQYLFPLGILILNAREYIDWQMKRALYWFDQNFGDYVRFRVIGYTTWDSDDSYNSVDLLLEAIRETGFNKGLYFDGVRATVLIAFTAQSIIDVAGLASPYDKAILVYHQEEWADDNDIMHELSHLYIAEPPADTPHGACVMSTEITTVLFYWEPLAPDYGSVLLDIFGTGPAIYFTYDWCAECKRIMIEKMTSVYDPPPDPWSEPLKMDVTGRILFFIALTFGILGIAFLLTRKFGKAKRLRADNRSSFYLGNLKLMPRLIQLLEWLLDYDHGILNFLNTMIFNIQWHPNRHNGLSTQLCNCDGYALSNHSQHKLRKNY